MNKEEYQEKLNSIYNNRYMLLSECNSISDKVLIKDTICGGTFEKTANEFTRKRVQERYNKFCPCCKPDKSLSKEFCQNELNKLTKNRIEILNYGGSSHAKSIFKCKDCGYEWSYNYHGLISNLKKNKNIDKSFGCAVCSNKKKKSDIEFKEQIKEIYGDDIEVLGVYVNTNTPITVKCNICGCIYNPYPVDLLYKYKEKNHTNGCPDCYEKRIDSIGITFIKSILTENNIEYETQIKFEDCKYKRQLPFDIGIKIDNNYILIEYDGDQHDTGWKGNTEKLEIQKIRDKIKDDYCKNNNIPFLRVRYTQTWDEIENSLYKFLKENNI